MSRAVAVALARRAGARSLRAPASQGSSLHVGLAGARPPAARASSLGYFGRLRAPRTGAGHDVRQATAVPVSSELWFAAREVSQGGGGARRGSESEGRIRRA